MGMDNEPVGGEFISLVNLVASAKRNLKKLDKLNPLLKCNIKKTGTGLSYSSNFGEKYYNIPLNRALERHYSQLNLEINKLKNK